MQTEIMKRGQQQSQTSDEESRRKIAAVYGLAKMCGGDIDEYALKLWLSVLSPFTANQVDAGFRAFVETVDFGRGMPAPVKVLNKIREVCNIPSPVEQKKSREMQADAAWLDVRDKIGRVGSYGSPSFDPTTARVIRAMGGWPAVCLWETASMAFKRKDFIRLWLNYAEAGDAVELGAEGVKVAVEGRAALSARDLPDPSERRIPSGFLKRIQ